eukprot:1584861-Rhodomonas_salina.3
MRGCDAPERRPCSPSIPAVRSAGVSCGSAAAEDDLRTWECPRRFLLRRRCGRRTMAAAAASATQDCLVSARALPPSAPFS